MQRDEQWRPVAYLSLQDAAVRANLTAVLENAGWTTVDQPTGFHLIQGIAHVIDGDRPWLRPTLIIVDARSRGCAGTTIAMGLRDLGIAIPIVLVAAEGEQLPITPDDTVRVVDHANAAALVAELARVRYRRRGDPAPALREAS